MLVNLGAPATSAAQESETKNSPHHEKTSPIEHVIVIIGENRTFDHIFATYKPRRGETVSNLLSQGIVNGDGTPGPNFSLASQSSAEDTAAYQLSPSNNVGYPVLPPVLAGGYTTPPFPDVATAKQYENGLPDDYMYTSPRAAPA